MAYNSTFMGWQAPGERGRNNNSSELRRRELKQVREADQANMQWWWRREKKGQGRCGSIDICDKKRWQEEIEKMLKGKGGEDG